MSIRVLHVLNNLGTGGAESFVMNVYRNIDREKVQFDFLIRSTQNGPMLEEIQAMGGKVFIQPAFPRHVRQNYKALDEFLKTHAREYQAIHVHANSLIYVKPLQLAMKYGIPRRIIHSHSTKSSALVLHRLNINRIDKWVTDRFACSEVAGEWMFPGKNYRVITNGIDLPRFAFDAQNRDEIRKKLHIEDKTVIGHVGRFTPQKNHPFVVEVFEAYHRKNPDSVLLLVGEGEDKERIWNQVLQKGLFDDVIFTGAVSDVWKYLSAMDAFLFPSLWEGFPVTLVETQVNGLPVLVSDKVTKTTKLSENVFFLDVNLSPDKWSKKISEISRKPGGGGISPQLLQYDIKRVALDLQIFYSGK